MENLQILIKIYQNGKKKYKNTNKSSQEMKLVDTKDLKAVGFTKQSVHRSPRQSKHPIKFHNFNLAFN